MAVTWDRPEKLFVRIYSSAASKNSRTAALRKSRMDRFESWAQFAAALEPMLSEEDATISRLKSGAYVLETGSKAYELAQLFVRLFRGLSAITGGDDEAARSWLRGPNMALRARPIDRIVAIAGLFETVAYVDSRRARV